MRVFVGNPSAREKLRRMSEATLSRSGRAASDLETRAAWVLSVAPRVPEGHGEGQGERKKKMRVA